MNGRRKGEGEGAIRWKKSMERDSRPVSLVEGLLQKQVHEG